MIMSPICFLADGVLNSWFSTVVRTASFVRAISRLSEWRSFGSLVRWERCVGTAEARYVLTSMYHLCPVEEIQPK